MTNIGSFALGLVSAGGRPGSGGSGWIGVLSERMFVQPKLNLLERVRVTEPAVKNKNRVRAAPPPR